MKTSNISKAPLLFACAAWLALGTVSLTSSALEPAGGSPLVDAPAADGQRDASAEDTSLAPDQPASPTARSWLARGSTSPVVETASHSSSSSSTGFTLGAVLIVLALGAGAVVFRFKRQKQLPLAPSESRLTVLSSSRVGPKAFAVTAHVNGRVLLLGVTDHNVSNLGWLDTREPEAQAAPHEVPEAEEVDRDDDLPDDYPGSALRASKPPQTFASASDLRRFQEVLRGAVQSRTDLPMRPSYVPPSDAASQLAAQTTDVVGSSALAKPALPVSLRRKRRARESLPPRDPRARESVAPREPRSAAQSLMPRDPRSAAQSRAASSAEASLEGQVAGLRSLRNGG
jgi:flagellar biogenesis protein FliO